MKNAVDIFFRRESRQFKPESIYTYRLNVDFPVNTPQAVQRIMDIAAAQRISRGSARSGIFQIQSNDGIWTHRNERRIDLSTPRRAALVTFQTWDELEAAEAANPKNI